MTQVAVTFSPSATKVAIEDLKDGDVVHGSQLLPTESFNVSAVYELAYLGLSDKGIAGKLRSSHEMVVTHFPRTLAQARADAATAALLRLNDTANGDFAPNKAQHDATKFMIEKRLDPIAREPTVLIAQTFKGVEGANRLSIEEINEL